MKKKLLKLLLVILIVVIEYTMISFAVAEIPAGVKKNYKYNQTDASIVTVKKRLQELGYFEKNTEFSNEVSVYLKEAVMAFQKQNNVIADGILDEDLLELLFSDNAAGKDGKPKLKENTTDTVQEETGKKENNVINRSMTDLNTDKDKNSKAVITIVFLVAILGISVALLGKRLNREKKEIDQKNKVQKEEHLWQNKKETDRERYNEEKRRQLLRNQQIALEKEKAAREAEEHRLVVLYSQRYRQLNEMITKYRFETGLKTHFRFSYVFHSRRIFDETEPHDALAFLTREDTALKNVFEKVKSNRQKIERFMRENEIIRQSSNMAISNSGVPKERFLQIEKELCRRLQDRVALDLVINLDLYYRSVGGNKHASRLYELNFEDLEKAYSIRQIPEIEYACTQEEREKMTLSLRYDILRRDGFRCVLCGATADDGAKLHVDHIMPVSKGGKTVPSNLRTLCDRCNFGKRDKYNPNGPN